MTSDIFERWLKTAGTGQLLVVAFLFLCALWGYAWAVVMVIQRVDPWWKARHVGKITSEGVRRFYAWGPEKRKS